MVAGQQGALGDIQVHVSEPDERVRATMEAAQAGIPYNKSATDLGVALDAAIAEMHADGSIVAILKSYGLDGTAANIGEPRLIE